MFPCDWLTLLRRARRRIAAGLALIAYCLAASGLHLPAAAAKDHDEPVSAASPKGPSCCPGAETGAHNCCCCGSSTASPKCCCGGHANSSASTPAKDSQTQSTMPPPSLLYVSPAKCQCLPTLWIVMGEVCPPPPLLAWLPYLLPTGWVSSAVTSTHARPLAPLDPPPRPFSV